MASEVRIASEALSFTMPKSVGTEPRPRPHRSRKFIMSMDNESPDWHEYSNVESDSDLSDSRLRSASDLDHKSFWWKNGKANSVEGEDLLLVNPWENGEERQRTQVRPLGAVVAQDTPILRNFVLYLRTIKTEKSTPK